MIRFVTNQWFLLALFAVLLSSYLGASALAPFAGSGVLRHWIVASVVFVMALPLETRLVWDALRKPWAASLGCLINMGLLPLVAWPLSLLLPGDLATGMMIAAVAPCTLASASVWTRRAGGNDAVSILVTLATNLTCFVITPLWLAATTGTSAPINFQQMATRLVLLVVIPMAIAQVLRQLPSVAAWSAHRKQILGTLAQIGILSMVCIGAVKCRLELGDTNWQASYDRLDLVVMVVLVTGLHIGVLTAGYLLSRGCGFDRADSIAVSISGSQKTFTVGLYVAINYFAGLAILPMIVYHVGQLIIDTVAADRWKQHQP